MENHRKPVGPDAVMELFLRYLATIRIPESCPKHNLLNHKIPICKLYDLFHVGDVARETAFGVFISVLYIRLARAFSEISDFNDWKKSSNRFIS